MASSPEWTKYRGRGSPKTVRTVGVWMLFGWAVFVAFWALPWRIAFNFTPSEPRGVYLLRLLTPAAPLTVGQVISFRYRQPWPIPPYTEYANGAQFLKRIAAVPGDVLNTVGRCQFRVSHEGKPDPEPLGCALAKTPSGIPIPRFAVFHDTVVPPGMVYTIGDGNPLSYDSRYFGLVPRKSVVGTARLIWRINP